VGSGSSALYLDLKKQYDCSQEELRKEQTWHKNCQEELAQKTHERDQLQKVCKDWQQKYERLEQSVKEYQQQNGQLRDEIMKRQLASNIRSKFPTIKEVADSYEMLRSNSHCNLQKCIFDALKIHAGIKKEGKRSEEEKVLLRTVHQWLWDMLMDCYSAMYEYKLDIYNQIGSILLIDNVLGQESLIDDAKTSNEKIEPQTEKKMNALKFMIGHHMQSHYETILTQKPEYPNTIAISEQNVHSTESKLTQVINKLRKRYEEKIRINLQTTEEENEEMKELMEDYLKSGCELCWKMILQDTVLSWSPTEFEPKQKEYLQFNNQKHRMCYGSDKNASQIWYYVLPSIQCGNDACWDVLSWVVTGYSP